MKKILAIVLIISTLPLFASAETDYQEKLRKFVTKRDNIIFNLTNECRDSSMAIFLAQSLKEAGDTYQSALSRHKDKSIEVRQAIDDVFKNNYTVFDLFKYSNKVYQNCILEAREDIRLPKD